MSGALFEQDGSRFLPTELARGPWTPEALHGGPPAALLARCAERVPGGDGTIVARLTVELLRPVPVSPLAVETRVLRPGRKVQLVGASRRRGRRVAARRRSASAPSIFRCRPGSPASRLPVGGGAQRLGGPSDRLPGLPQPGRRASLRGGAASTGRVRHRLDPAPRSPLAGEREPARSRGGGRRLRQRRQLGPLAQRWVAVHRT
jgi:hypothetical protein